MQTLFLSPNYLDMQVMQVYLIIFMYFVLLRSCKIVITFFHSQIEARKMLETCLRAGLKRITSIIRSNESLENSHVHADRQFCVCSPLNEKTLADQSQPLFLESECQNRNPIHLPSFVSVMQGNSGDAADIWEPAWGCHELHTFGGTSKWEETNCR